MRTIPTEKNVETYYKDGSACIQFLLDNNLIPTPERCQRCEHGELRRHLSKPTVWHCNNRNCRKKVSIFANTFFAKSNIPCCDLMRIFYKWLCGQKYSDILIQTGHTSKTVSDYLRFLRELVSEDLSEDHCIIGGPGIVVEIDESKFGKVKHHRGRRVEGAWVLGGVERTPERNLFLVVVPDRCENTLMHVLIKHIAPGSIVHTDLWKAYHQLQPILGVSHLTVNHSLHFKDPITGVHSNTIEGTWAGIKFKVSPRCRTDELLDSHLSEFIWRRQNANRLWDALLESIRNVNYI